VKNLEGCDEDLKSRGLRFLEEADKAGIEVLIYMGYRSNAEQDYLYAQGRTRPGAKVTNRKGGKSVHNSTKAGKPASKAFDCVPLVKGVPDWDNKDLYEKLGKIGESLGLEWGGRWKKFVDKPHFQLPGAKPTFT